MPGPLRTCDKHRNLRLDGAVVPVQGADDGRGDEVGEDDQVAPFQSLVTPLSVDGPSLPLSKYTWVDPLHILTLTWDGFFE